MLISLGDFNVNDSDQQHVQDILKAEPGHFYQHPTLGAGVNRLIAASVDPSDIEKSIRIGLEADNYNPREVKVSNDFEVSIDATRLK